MALHAGGAAAGAGPTPSALAAIQRRNEDRLRVLSSITTAEELDGFLQDQRLQRVPGEAKVRCVVLGRRWLLGEDRAFYLGMHEQQHCQLESSAAVGCTVVHGGRDTLALNVNPRPEMLTCPGRRVTGGNGTAAWTAGLQGDDEGQRAWGCHGNGRARRAAPRRCKRWWRRSRGAAAPT